MRFLQINLHHSNSATAALYQQVAEGKADIALIQEPCLYKGRIRGLNNTGEQFTLLHPVIRGHMLSDFCERNGLIVTNTWFKRPKRRLYTWKAPGDWRRLKLDYILVKHRFGSSAKNVKTLPGADIDSDHNLLVAKFRTRLKKIIRFQKRRPG
ncbi:hypothetical protein B7P43_G14388 [Cryptotermes secundus]|uniref:Endonuclease/exonuclease/phosphatase domain-containing protein n=1 Tax=Cryptotermes secundus TaxID=105785 RepID=A0A2J7RKQ2_9NEOP|nr:hypothetical protein B7P43_G14388 [Cryptotermes secundus]